MNADQIASLVSFSPTSQGEFVHVDIPTPGDLNKVTVIKCRGDRDGAIRVVGLHGLSDAHVAILLNCGREGVMIHFCNSEGVAQESYPMGKAEALKKTDNDQMTAVANFKIVIFLNA